MPVKRFFGYTPTLWGHSQPRAPLFHHHGRSTRLAEVIPLLESIAWWISGKGVYLKPFLLFMMGRTESCTRLSSTFNWTSEAVWRLCPLNVSNLIWALLEFLWGCDRPGLRPLYKILILSQAVDVL
jgi:hypothetical protein